MTWLAIWSTLGAAEVALLVVAVGVAVIDRVRDREAR